MELSLHANATTTPKTRAYIQRSRKSVAQLAAELGVSETTIYRWRSRTTVEDRSHRPKNLTTSASPRLKKGPFVNCGRRSNCRWTTSLR
ncbi:helix-turn-helix domain-containing protein [Bradyrhizobium australafricanum]|uniref:helix-turn-helix domain-containing protein n=1 Tax=Bradyrhizobium australafricanum TaxID=2821406 RepID=UPI001CE2CD3A|nr:helix-turn-helix domain-containing protein [Bradyrhizobium australafricanum]